MEQLGSWLEWIEPSLRAKLDEALANGTRGVTTLAIRASNGLFAARLEVPARFRKDEFLVNRRKMLPKILSSVASEVKIERISADTADLRYIYGRNLGSQEGLSGKSVLLVGCGTIGSFLAQQLAMCGAGTQGGRLNLIDSDVLRTANIGRHVLGVPYLHRNKAEACADYLSSMLPGLRIEGRNADAMKEPIDKYDAVIDATGEEALSIALNQRVVDQRPFAPAHFFVWLAGNGAAAQCLLVDGDNERACLKCLKPVLSGPARFPLLRPDVPLEVGSVQACADAGFIPFPVSRSVAAAAMVCDLILDWSNGHTGHRFRTITLDPTKAFTVKNQSPAWNRHCPACVARRSS